jgi:hypothetical protein
MFPDILIYLNFDLTFEQNLLIIKKRKIINEKNSTTR